MSSGQKMQTVRLIAIGFLSLILTACGNKGDLYLESESVVTSEIKTIGDSIDEIDELDELDELDKLDPPASENQPPEELDDEAKKNDKNK